MSNDWLIGPVADCMSYISDECIVTSLLERGVTALNGVSVYLTAILALHEFPGEQKQQIEQLIEMADDSKKMAAHFNGKILLITNAHSVVGIWAKIEAMVENLIVNHLENGLPSRSTLSERFGGLNVEKKLTVDFISNNPYDAVRILQQHITRTSSSDVDATLKLLNNFDVTVHLDERMKSDLIELSQVRNLFMHRAGVVDKKFKQRCPWTHHEVGSTYTVERETYLRFFDAASAFLNATLEAVVQSPYIYKKPT